MPRMQSDLSQNVGLAGYLQNLVGEHPDFEVLCKPTEHLCCFRYMPNGLQDDQHEVEQFLDRINREIVESVRREGFELITTTQVGDRFAIRISISERITIEDIEAMFEAIARWGRLRTRKQLSSANKLTRNMELMQC